MEEHDGVRISSGSQEDIDRVERALAASTVSSTTAEEARA